MNVTSVLIVTWNNEKTIAQCIRSVRESTYEGDVEILVWDNNSSDNTPSVASACGATVFSSDRNVGFARGTNLLARKARGDVLVLLNPDAFASRDALDRLVDAVQCCGDAVVGGRLNGLDGAIQIACARPFTSARRHVWWLLSGRSPAWHVELRERDVDAISGAFMAVPTRLWSELNGFDECYPHSGEDVDLCFRAAQLNARVVFLPDAVATHARGVSVDQAPAEIDVLRWIGLIRLASKVEGPISALLIRATLALRATVVITLARLGMVRRSARDRERTRLLWKWCLSGSAPSLPATPTRTK